VASVEELFRRAVEAHTAGDAGAAEEDYRRVLQLDPAHVPALTNLGVLLVGRGELEEARRCYTAALRADPHAPDTHFNLGNLHRRQGRLVEAAAAYAEALRLAPGHAPACLNLGLVAGDTGDWAAAADYLRRATELDPDRAEAFNLLWDALARLGRHADAERAIREFLARCPDDPRGHLNRGLTLAALGRYDESVEELQTALELRPDYAEAHNALGIALEGTGRHDEATEHYLRAVRLRPDWADAWSNLGVSLAGQGRVRDALAALDRALDLRPDPVRAGNRLVLLLGSSGVSPGRLRAEHEGWAARYADRFAPAPGQVRYPQAGPRLRVGYVFGPFRSRHAAAFLETLLARHDRTRFHVTAYPNTARTDPALERVRRLADTCKPLLGLSDDDAAELVRSDEIDVLIDLCGHTAGNRLLVFARKPARTQVTLYGYPCTTGLKTIDYRITDGLADPPGVSDSFGTEKLLRLPSVGWLYVPPPASPEPGPLPAGRNRTFTFGCLSDPAKLSDVCLDTWAAVLRAVPQSRLVLAAGRSPSAARDRTERFSRLGVAHDRLEWVHRLPASEYLRAYQPLDVVLDPFPFNGRTATCDALWMGVPVLSLAGADSRGRQGLSILTNLGMADFVADDLDRFVELAATWAGQRDGLAELRADLRGMMAASPLTDAAAYVRDLEAALVRAVATASTG